MNSNKNNNKNKSWRRAEGETRWEHFSRVFIWWVLRSNSYKFSTDINYSKALNAGLGIFLALLILVGVVRVGWISVFHRGEYRESAQLNSYTESTVKATRGTIYDSRMNVLSVSYGVYDFSVDPFALHQQLNNDLSSTNYYELTGGKAKELKKNDSLRSQIVNDMLTRYYKYISKAIAYVLSTDKNGAKAGLSAGDIFKKLNSLYRLNDDGSYKLKNGKKIENHYQSIVKQISSETKQEMTKILSDCYYSFYYDCFICSGSYLLAHPDADESEQAGNVWLIYDYENKSYRVLKEEKSDFASIAASKKSLERFNNSIIREGGTFLFEEIEKRSYPTDNFCSSFLGFVSGGTAVGGLEAYYDGILSGKDGKVSGLAVNGAGVMKSASGEIRNNATEGGNLVLTVEPQIQKILEDNLKSVYERYGADETYGIVMNCKTGAIYGMGNYPNFDLNNPSEITAEESALEKAEREILLDNEARNILDDDGEILQPTESEIREKALNNQWMNFNVSYPAELGSTFKIFTASAAIEEGTLDPSDGSIFYSCKGSYLITKGDKPIACSHGAQHGSLDLGTALAKSCNGFFIHLGLTLGSKTFTKYFKEFGLNEKTGVDLANESAGISRTSENMTRTELGSTAYGQTATITPMQLITAASAVANGGKLMTPYIVDKIIDSDGNLIAKSEPTVKRQVISEETSKLMTSKLKRVIYDSYGTAHDKFTLQGYTAAGKTGSGEIQGQGKSSGSNGFKYTASFVGWAPAEDPQVIILFGIRNPQGGYLSGGEIAAPPAATIMQFALDELNIPKNQADAVSSMVPALTELPLMTAKILALNASMTVFTVGSGSSVLKQNPDSGNEKPDSSLVALFTDEESYAKTAEVPSFEGMTKAAAIEAARKAGVNIVCINYNSSNDKIIKQNEDVGEKVYPGDIIKVTFGE